MAGRRPGDFRAGIGIPLLRSLGLALAVAVIAVGVGAAVDDMRASYALMGIGILATWLFDKHIRPNKAAEDAARRRYFGLDE